MSKSTTGIYSVTEFATDLLQIESCYRLKVCSDSVVNTFSLSATESLQIVALSLIYRNLSYESAYLHKNTFDTNTHHQSQNQK